MELSPEGKRLIQHALTARAWTLEKLAEQSEIGISTVKNFNSGKSVSRVTFVTLCKALEIDWEIASGQAIAPCAPPSDRPSTQSQLQDDLFQQVKERCRQKILNQHSRMRLLSGEEIGVDQLYVDVWLLNRSPRTYQVLPDKLLETFDLRNDRLGLGDRIKRNPGFEVANDNPKLVILGKPGSGKTTFLKHLAVDWCNGKFQPNFIVVLIELRRIQDGQWQLRSVIDKILNNQWQLLDEIGKELGLENQREVKELLQRGKLLVLMDGLDEVPTSGLRRTVQNQLQQFARDYPTNRFILTCRTQIITSIPVNFASVEVADFSEQQVEQFVRNWFTASSQSDAEATRQRETFENAIGRNPALKELTVTPVLLSLMCWALQDEGEMPSQVNKLYEKGIRLLLSKWNDAKEIEEWEVGSEIYKGLSVERREALLIEIAARKFENPENFVLFDQEEIASHITRFLQLADPREGVKVLQAIEAQHGLLIERADELWSFSHLTFQEHFTIQWLTELPAKQLAAKIANQQWQKQVKRLVESQQPADRLVRLIKQAIDQSILTEPTLQEVLVRALEKSESILANYKPAAIRAFYLVCDLTLTRAFDRILDRNRDRARDLARFRNRIFARDLDLVRDLDCTLASICVLARASNLTRVNFSALDHDLDLDLILTRAYVSALDLTSDRAFHTSVGILTQIYRNSNHDIQSARKLPNDLALARDLALDSELISQLEQLKAQLHLPSRVILFGKSETHKRWEDRGSQWVEQLGQVMLQHRNISHSWQLSPDQRQQLQHYYQFNCFLVELINIEGAVSKKVRAEIEDSLLLPWEELQHRYPETYGQSQSS